METKTDKPEALWLADALTTQADCNCYASSYFECACDAIWPEQWIDHAAAQLRRLHAENEALQNTKHYEAPRGFVLNPDYLVPELRAQRDALLEALKLSRAQWIHSVNSDHCLAAIAKAEGQQ